MASGILRRKILFLYTDVQGYVVAVLRAIATIGEARVVVYCKKPDEMTPYRHPEMEGVEIRYNDELSGEEIRARAEDLDPDLVYVSGWMNKAYMPAVKRMRALGKPVVSGLDNIWYGNLKQKALALFGARWLRRRFSHMWVAGPMQYAFATRLGYTYENVLYNLYTANVAPFHAERESARAEKRASYPRRILYVGRLIERKGVDILLDAYLSLPLEKRAGWTLELVGNGPLKENLLARADESVVVEDFLQPEEVAKRAARAGLFCLPSLREPFGVVVHEFAAAGVPMVVSDNCGAAPAFVKSGINGATFRSGSVRDLREKLETMLAKSDDEIFEMGERSYELSKQNTPEIAAASFLSALE